MVANLDGQNVNDVIFVDEYKEMEQVITGSFEHAKPSIK